MTYDAIVIGAGHNGLTAAALLQRAGLRTLCLEAKLYAGGMASTVELFEGYQFEIAGSLQFPTSAVVSAELGLDELPGVEVEVMSVSLRGTGDQPFVYYTDLMRLMTHISEVHGAEVIDGMANLAAWAQAPTQALGRFDHNQPPRSLDEMYACATTPAQREAITDLLFGSVTDVLDRFLPDRDKHGALRGMLAFLAVNTTYRGPSTPGSAASLAYGFAVPDEKAALMRKLQGGIGTLTRHLLSIFEAAGGELRLRTTVEAVRVVDGRVVGVRLADGTEIDAPIVVSGIAPDLTVSLTQDVSPEVRQRFARVDHRGSYLQMHFALDGPPVFDAPYELLNDPANQAAIGLFVPPEELQEQWEASQHGIVPANPAIAFQIPSAADPHLAPPGKHAASAFALWLPIGATAAQRGELAQRIIDKITRLAPNFERIILRHTAFTPHHMETMFGAPGGDYCHGLVHPEQLGPNRPGPTGFRDLPLGIEGLFLGSAGCHGGPGITFIPGYNAAKAALASR